MKKNARFEKLTISELSKITGGAAFTDRNRINGGNDYSYGTDGKNEWTTCASGDTSTVITKDAVWF